MAAIALPHAAAAEQDAVDAAGEGRRLHQRMAEQVILQLRGQPLVQRAAAIQLVVVLHAAGMPAGRLRAQAPVPGGVLQRLGHRLPLLRLEQRLQGETHGCDAFYGDVWALLTGPAGGCPIQQDRSTATPIPPP